MKGIIKLTNRHTGEVVGYFKSEDLDESRLLFKSEHRLPGSKRQLPSYISYEVAEVTNNPDERLAELILPQISRVKYDKSVAMALGEKRMLKRINRVVDWVVETFIGASYSFEIGVIRDGLKAHVGALVYKEGKKYEGYLFGGNKYPRVRYNYTEEDI